MDKTIRRNERCIIGLPRCDFVFSSTRTCFIAYGFKESSLEMNVLRAVLKDFSIEAVEAGGDLAPAQSAFCAKICSKIITSQFCAVLLNNDEDGDREIPNANVNMEYGLMLGFNKYILPFQRESQKLPFNVAGLDTIKYSNSNFERLARSAVAQAIRETQQESGQTVPLDQDIGTFLLTKKALVCPLTSQGEQDVFRLGSPLNFNLLNDFGGVQYTFFGNFTALRPEAVLWRVRLLDEILAERIATMAFRVQVGVGTQQQADVATQLLSSMRMWLLLSSDDDKAKVLAALQAQPVARVVEVFSKGDVADALQRLAK